MGEKQKVKTPQAQWHCSKCGNIFRGPKQDPTCPECNEKIDLVPLNPNEIPLKMAERATGAGLAASGHSLGQLSEPLKLELPEGLDPAELARQSYNIEMQSLLQEHYIEKLKARAAEEKTKRIKAERELQAAQEGGSGEVEERGGWSGTAMVGPSMVMSVIANMPDDARNNLLDRFEKNPNLATVFSMLFTPPQFGGYQAAMNPYMLSSLTAPPQHYAERGESNREGGSSIKDVADAVKSLIEAAHAMKSDDSSVNDVINTFAHKLDEITQQNYNFQISITEKLSDLFNPSNRSEGAQSRVGKEDIERLVIETIERAGLNKTPTELLSEVGDYLDAADRVKERFTTTKEDKETFDQWLKRTEFQYNEEDKKRLHERDMKALEVQKAKSDTVKSLLTSTLLGKVRQAKPEEKKKEIKFHPVYDNILFALAQGDNPDVAFSRHKRERKPPENLELIISGPNKGD